MGMFDDLTCEYPLPDSPPEAQQIPFQTKSLYCAMDHYVIRADGSLVLEHWEMEETPLAEKPYPSAPEGTMQWMAGSYRRKAGSQQWIPISLDGSIRFYGDTFTGQAKIYTPGKPMRAINAAGEEEELPPTEWFEYVAWFEDGQLFKIKRVARE